MCKACDKTCCDADHLAECGCSDCIEPNCWTGWEASQERDPGDEQPTVLALLTLAVGSITEKEANVSNTWEPVEPKQVGLREDDITHYTATADWLEFDCICMDKDAPDYENLPYDFVLQDLDTHHFSCARCGRQYRVKVKVEVEMYTPIAIKYPDAKYSMTPESLGLRDKEA